jgi:hypothetical protein
MSGAAGLLAACDHPRLLGFKVCLGSVSPSLTSTRSSGPTSMLCPSWRAPPCRRAERSTGDAPPRVGDRSPRHGLGRESPVMLPERHLVAVLQVLRRQLEAGVIRPRLQQRGPGEASSDRRAARAAPADPAPTITSSYCTRLRFSPIPGAAQPARIRARLPRPLRRAVTAVARLWPPIAPISTPEPLASSVPMPAPGVAP